MQGGRRLTSPNPILTDVQVQNVELAGEGVDGGGAVGVVRYARSGSNENHSTHCLLRAHLDAAVVDALHSELLGNGVGTLQ